MPNPITINEAAEQMGCKPFEVVELIDSGLLRTVLLVDPTSVREYQENPHA